MLTITTYKKLSTIRLRDGLIVESIFKNDDRYSIWLSDTTNIELERTPHWQQPGGTSYYRIWIADGSLKAQSEFVTSEMIDTVGKMREYILFLHDKYKIPF